MLFHIFIGKCKQLVHYGRLLLFLTNFYFYIIDGGLFIFEAHSLAVWFLMHLSSCVRDYIHVTDIADAHLKALDFSSKNNFTQLECFNLGTGNGISVLEAIYAFEKVSGLSLKYKKGQRREGDVESIFSNSQKAEQVLNWSPQFDIEDMMRSAWKWQQNLNEEN